MNRTVLLAMLFGAPAFAQTTFTVTTTADDGAGSLRQAILDANANAGADAIHFDVPGSGVRTITLGSDLPMITDLVVIDGLTQPGAHCDPWPPTLLIEVTGELDDAFEIDASGGGSTIRGLVLNGYSGSGIDVSAADIRIECNFIGTNPAGTAAQTGGVFSEGVSLYQASGIVIGGPGPGRRNLISGNGDQEITLFTSTGVVIQGNFLGTDVTGTVDLSSSGGGVEGISVSQASDIVIGGTDHDEGVCNRACNLISGHDDEAVGVSSASEVTIQGNFIGPDVTGSVILGGEEEGVSVYLASDVTIGGTEPGAGNVIAGFGTQGVVIRASDTDPALGNAVLGNAIFANGLLGIDLSPPGTADGPTPNDPGDGDEGPNRLQNFPEFASATGDGVALTVAYVVPTATANAAYPLRVEFFLADADDEEGRWFIGSDTYEAADAEQQAVAAFAPAHPVLNGDRIVATATDADGNTSEFGAAVTVVGSAVTNESGAEAPSGFALSAAYPNPFNPSTVLTLDVPEAGRVTVAVFDLLGRRVALLHDGVLAAGTHALRFDAAGLPSGVYLIRATSGETVLTRRVTVVR